MTITAAPHGRVATARRRRAWSLPAGVVAGPLFLAISFAQVPFRDGFDLSRHAFSFLLLGPGGWVQTANFVVAGVLYAATSLGLRAALGDRTGGWAAVLVGALGAGMALAGLFAPDPSYGYPPGTPDGIPDQLSAGGVVHGLAFVVSMLSWCALLVVLATWFRRRAANVAAAAALVTAVALLVVPAATGQDFATVLLYAVVTAGFLVTSLLLSRVHAASNGA